MRRAIRLTAKGSLMDATRLIQRTLSGLGATAPSAPTTQAASAATPTNHRHYSGPTSRTGDVTDLKVKPASDQDILTATPSKTTPTRPAASGPATSPGGAPQPTQASLSPNFVLSPSPEHASAAAPSAWAPPPPAGAPAAPAHRPGVFTQSSIQFRGDQYAYRLYIPARPTSTGTGAGHAVPGLLPLVVLLHGCKQTALDFAKGTGMNLLADQQQVVVLYPEQLSKANSGGCWNWFEPTHQTRSGEPGMIADLTRTIMSSRHADVQIDPARVYIAGLSAGGAMSAVVAELYPDIFAAVGVHSGLPAGAAKSMMGAFAAMRRGGPVQTVTAMPTIIFHGTADTTVHPDNGEHVSNAARAALGNTGLDLVKSEQTVRTQGQRPAQRVSYLDNSGKPYVEHWTVGDGGHAWSGGNAAGSYTDPQGPSASRAMLAFFLQHKKE